MKILFCGTNVSEEIEYQVRDISAAGNRFQNNLVRNLKKCGHEVIECSYIGVPIPENIRQQQKGNVVFKTNGFLKSVLAYRRMARKLMDDTDIIMCYNITYAWLLLPIWACQKKKQSIAIIADYSEAESYHRLPGKVYAYLQRVSMRHFDTVVGLSANIAEKLKEKQRFVLMEGGIDQELYDAFSYQEAKEKNVIHMLYSGLLSHVTGVDKLLEIMQTVKNPKLRLLISGKGDLEDAVKEFAEEDKRIIYLGHLPYEEYVKQLKEADVLLNPRNMELPENQNNFPSKIMDYLAAGKTIISTKFVGWERFQEYIIFCKSYEEMAEQLEKITIAQSKEVYDRNRKFAGEFLWMEQIKRILKK